MLEYFSVETSLKNEQLSSFVLACLDRSFEYIKISKEHNSEEDIDSYVLSCFIDTFSYFWNTTIKKDYILPDLSVINKDNNYSYVFNKDRNDRYTFVVSYYGTDDILLLRIRVEVDQNSLTFGDRDDF